MSRERGLSGGLNKGAAWPSATIHTRHGAGFSVLGDGLDPAAFKSQRSLSPSPASRPPRAPGTRFFPSLGPASRHAQCLHCPAVAG